MSTGLFWDPTCVLGINTPIGVSSQGTRALAAWYWAYSPWLSNIDGSKFADTPFKVHVPSLQAFLNWPFKLLTSLLGGGKFFGTEFGQLMLSVADERLLSPMMHAMKSWNKS